MQKLCSGFCEEHVQDHKELDNFGTMVRFAKDE